TEAFYEDRSRQQRLLLTRQDSRRSAAMRCVPRRHSTSRGLRQRRKNGVRERRATGTRELLISIREALERQWAAEHEAESLAEEERARAEQERFEDEPFRAATLAAGWASR